MDNSEAREKEPRRKTRTLDIARISVVLCKYAERFESAEAPPPGPSEPESFADWREQPPQPVYQAV